jgi:hypothetical protein|tara:strand:- start:48 stop:533 length:486 start_codon:yes stop_codon:yes gene_type:complete
MLKNISLPINSKRIITENNVWNELVADANYNNQIYYIENINEINETIQKLIYKELTKKINSYKSQDIKKKILNKEKLVKLDNVVELLLQSKNKCFYCKNDLLILYENVRENNQWTLDRIDNNYGHNIDNVMISCLKCNVHRKTMYHERYLFTKELNIIKKE